MSTSTPLPTPQVAPPTREQQSFSRLDLTLALVGGAALVGVASTAGTVFALAGFAAAVYLVFCLRRIELIGYTLVAIVPVASGLARGLPIPGVRLTEAMAVAAALVVLPRNRGRRSVRWQVLDWAAFGYVAVHVVVGGIAAFLNDALVSEDLGLLIGPAQFFLLYRVVVSTIDTPQRRTNAIRLLLFMVVPVALLALAQYLGAPGVQSAIEGLTGTGVFDLYSYDFTRRATGPFAAWHPLAGYLFMPMILAAALALQKHSPVMSRGAAATVLAFGIMALLVSQTLNVLAGAVVCFIVVALLQGTDRRVLASLVAMMAVVGLVFAPVVGQRVDSQRVEDPTSQSSVLLPETIQFRLDVWQDQFIPAVVEHWMIGYGPGLPPEITWRYTESLYFTLLLRGGVALMGAFIVFMVVTARTGLRLRTSPDLAVRAVAVTLVAAIAALVPMHAVFPYFTASGLPQVFWILLALITSSLNDQRPSAGQSLGDAASGGRATAVPRGRASSDPPGS